jgi:hypothetical protein
MLLNVERNVGGDYTHIYVLCLHSGLTACRLSMGA